MGGTAVAHSSWSQGDITEPEPLDGRGWRQFARCSSIAWGDAECAECFGVPCACEVGFVGRRTSCARRGDVFDFFYVGSSLFDTGGEVYKASSLLRGTNIVGLFQAVWTIKPAGTPDKHRCFRSC